MRYVLIFLGIIVYCDVSVAANGVDASRSDRSIAAVRSPPATGQELVRQPLVRQAAACGYFAILGCFRSESAAINWMEKIDNGHVINTTSMRYPSFQPGYHCVVNGPTSQYRAHAIANIWRSVVPQAYVKNPCQ